MAPLSACYYIIGHNFKCGCARRVGLGPRGRSAIPLHLNRVVIATASRARRRAKEQHAGLRVNQYGGCPSRSANIALHCTRGVQGHVIAICNSWSLLTSPTLSLPPFLPCKERPQPHNLAPFACVMRPTYSSGMNHPTHFRSTPSLIPVFLSHGVFSARYVRTL